MNEATLSKIIAELEPELVGHQFGKVFLQSRYRIVVDFRLSGSRYLLLSLEPAAARMHLIKRRLSDLTESSRNPSPFIGLIRNKLSNATLSAISKVPDDRVVRFEFAARDDVGRELTYFLAAQLTGRSANLFLLDQNEMIIDSIRQSGGNGQEPAMRYAPPQRALTQIHQSGARIIFPQGDFATLSEALDACYAEREAEERFQAKFKSARKRIAREISKRTRLINNLNQDLKDHGNADIWKRSGDLLLANVHNANRSGNIVSVIDYFSEDTPSIDIEIGDNETIPEAAARFFKLYTKARNARIEIAGRLAEVERELGELQTEKGKLEQACIDRDESAITAFTGETEKNRSRAERGKSKGKFSGARKFISSEGFEILVGRRAKPGSSISSTGTPRSSSATTAVALRSVKRWRAALRSSTGS